MRTSRTAFFRCTSPRLRFVYASALEILSTFLLGEKKSFIVSLMAASNSNYLGGLPRLLGGWIVSIASWMPCSGSLELSKSHSASEVSAMARAFYRAASYSPADFLGAAFGNAGTREICRGFLAATRPSERALKALIARKSNLLMLEALPFLLTSPKWFYSAAFISPSSILFFLS